MITRKGKLNRRNLKLLRFAVIIFLFGLAMHAAYRERAIMAGNSLKNNDMSSFPGAVSRAPGVEEFEATAYCINGITKSGARVAPGHVAADPKVIPLGSMIYVDSPVMSGIYQVLDTGRLVKGKIIDIFIPSYEERVDFGRRDVKVQVSRHGSLGHDPENESRH